MYKLTALALLPLAMIAQTPKKTVGPKAATPKNVALEGKPNMSAKGKIGIRLEYLDSTVNLHNDFYKFANGKWFKSFEIPASEPSYGSFNEIQDRNQANLLAICNQASTSKTNKAGSNNQKVGDFYRLAMDSVKLNKEGITPLKKEFDAISAITSSDELVKTVADLHTKGVRGVFSFYVYTDMRSSNTHMAYLGQGGFGLPDRDFYFLDKYAPIKEEYAQHIKRMFVLLGESDEKAGAAAQTVMGIETELAKEAMNAVQSRDIEAQYNKTTRIELADKFKNVNWNLYFNSVGIENLNGLVVNQPKFVEHLNEIMTKTSLSDWKTYLRWQLIHAFANKISDDFGKENFSFYGTVLSGAKVQKPRWKRALAATDENLGEALGQMYVSKYFSADAKKKVNALVDNLMAAYRERIATRDWMTPETKKAANGKLDKILRKLGYPDKFKDYSKLSIKSDNYVSNVMRATQFEYKEMIAKLHKPVDRAEWGMTPPTVNAYYNPTSNEIAFPAGIMQVPFFDASADDAYNYGIMGAIIGHELTHGFDDQGAQFDADGNLVNWWTDVDKKNFEAKTKILVDQFNQLTMLDTLHVNGELTLGENIADLGGLTMAYYAYKKSLNGKPSTVLGGFTGEQRFFLSWAQGWKNQMRPAMIRQRLATDPHSPPMYRCNNTISNMPEFYEAFGIKEGDKLWRKADSRALIW